MRFCKVSNLPHVGRLLEPVRLSTAQPTKLRIASFDQKTPLDEVFQPLPLESCTVLPNSFSFFQKEHSISSSTLAIMEFISKQNSIGARAILT
jgi:hypothetical protein